MTAEDVFDKWRELQSLCVEVTFESSFLPWEGLVVCQINDDSLADNFVVASAHDPQNAFAYAYEAYQKAKGQKP